MISKKKIGILGILILFLLFFLVFKNLKIEPTLGSASLSWNENKESNLAGYKIYYGQNPRNADCPKGGYEKVVDVGKNAQYNISNLEPGKTYYFSVTSYNTSKKESCFSPEMKKVIEISKLEKIKGIFSKR